MKKIICLFLVLILIVFSACNGDTDITGDNSLNNNSTNVTTTSSDSSNTTTSSKSNANSEEINMRDIMNASAAPEADFTYHISSSEGYVIISAYNGSDDIVVVPETIEGYPVKEISDRAFANDCAGRAVRIADNVVEIGRNVFTNNKMVETVVCGKGLKTIGVNAFSYCEALNIVVLNENLETLKDNVFATCHNLKELIIPESVQSIQVNCIFDCPDTVVKVYAGSAAEQAAIEGHWNYEVI